MGERKFSYVKIRGKRILVIGDLITLPRIFFHPDTTKRVLWLEN